MELVNVAFHDIAASKYPISVYAYPEESTEDTEILWQRHLDGPGAMTIPGLKETGRRSRIVVRYGDGTEDRGPTR